MTFFLIVSGGNATLPTAERRQIMPLHPQNLNQRSLLPKEAARSIVVRWLGAGLLCLSMGSLLGQASIAFRDGKMSANIDSSNLPQILQTLSNATGWIVFLEPEATRRVSTRFQDRSVGDALPRIFGDLSYAVIPGADQRTRVYVYQSNLEEATRKIAPDPAIYQDTKASNRLENELLVTLNPGSTESIEEIAARLGAKILGRSKDGRSFRLGFDDQDAANAARRLLEDNDNIDQVDSNFGIPRPAAPARLGAGQAQPPTLKAVPPEPGEELIIGLIDPPADSVTPNIEDFILEPIELAGDSRETPDGTLSHGSAMAETIIRGLELVEPSESAVRILPVDVYGHNEQTTTFDVANGIVSAVNEGARIINLSLGGSDDNPYVERLVTDLSEQGILFFSAAGNEPVTTPTYPAAYDPVIAVTAGDRTGKIADYANRGAFVDLVAPGGSIVHNNENQSFYGNGTSFSTAYVSGAAGGLAGSSDFDVAEVRGKLETALGIRELNP